MPQQLAVLLVAAASPLRIASAATPAAVDGGAPRGSTGAAAAEQAPTLEFHPNVTNLGGGGPFPSQWVLSLSNTTADLAACGALCANYQAPGPAGPLSRCQSFTRVTATDPASGSQFRVPPGCYGHVDPVWLPLPGVDPATGAALAGSGLVVRPCESAFDCSHNGACTAGVCDCTQGWTGRKCETLDLLPVDRAKYGFSPTDKLGQNLSSWGGSILSEGGVWHMWAARMVNYCGIIQWQQNSKIVHATATDVLGPYTEQETAVAPVFAHEPTVTRDPRTGELLMVHVAFPVEGEFSNQSIFNASMFCSCPANCTPSQAGGQCKPNCPIPPQYGPEGHKSYHPFLPIVRTAPSAAGPWTEVVSPVLDQGDSNLACWINGTGGLTCNGRGGTTSALSTDWRNLSSWLDFKSDGRPTWVSSHPDDEDPMLWQDMETGVFHSIQHNLAGCPRDQPCQLGSHQFSLDGLEWFLTGAAYTNLVEYTDGSSHLFDRRERPHLVFEENTTRPIALSNSARPGGADGDRTFTLVQGLRVRTKPAA